MQRIPISGQNVVIAALSKCRTSSIFGLRRFTAAFVFWSAMLSGALQKTKAAVMRRSPKGVGPMVFYSAGHSQLIAQVQLQPVFVAILEEDMSNKVAKSYLSAVQKKLLRDQCAAIPAAVRTDFETAILAWKNTWFRGGLAMSSDPHTRAVGNEFD